MLGMAVFMRPVPLRALVYAFISAGIVFPCAAADAPASPRMPQANLRVDSSLVLIPVHVTTPMGTAVTGLRKENFQVFEDNSEQKITHFVKDDASLSIGILLDSSGSMENKTGKCSEAAAIFLQSANPGDEFFLVEFNDRARLTVPFTTDTGEVYSRIQRAKPFGRTSLLDAIYLASAQMKKAHNLRKALVIISDGGDNCSRHSVRETRVALLESDVQLFAFGIFGSAKPGKSTSEEQNGPILLGDLAEQTGGHLYTVDRIQDLPALSDKLGNELRNEYLLGYSSTNAARDGKYRQVKLRLTPTPEPLNLRTYYRRGYYAPTQ